MGIRNDIRPRKGRPIYHAVEQKPAPSQAPALPVNDVVPVNQTQKPEAQAAPTSNEPALIVQAAPQTQPVTPANPNPAPVSDKQLTDQFFGEQAAIQQQLNSTTAKPKKSHKLIFLFWSVLFLGIIGYAAYQNYASLAKPKTPEPDKTTVYSGEIVTQDEVEEETATDQTSTETTPAQTDEPVEAEPVDPADSAVAQTTTIDKSTISLRVLNGNGISNSAQTVKSTLTTAGFTVNAVANARKFTYDKTYIYYQTGKVAEATLVKDALTNRTTELVLSDTVAGSNNVVVVVGAK